MPSHSGLTHDSHRERGTALIEAIRSTAMKSYVDMLQRLNQDIVSELKRARGGLAKGNIVLAISPTGPLARPLENDLFKGSAPRPGLVEHKRTISRGGKYFEQVFWVRPGEEPPKDAKPEKEEEVTAPAELSMKEQEKAKKKAHEKELLAKRGRWYKDEYGNVRFSTKPTGVFTIPLSPEEAEQMHQNIAVVVSKLSRLKGDMMTNLAKAMEKDIGEDSLDVLNTFASCIDGAALSGVSVHDQFVQMFVQDLQSNQDEEVLADNPNAYDDDVLGAEADELFNNMVSAFKNLSDKPEWRKRADAAIRLRQLEDMSIAEKLREQSKITKGQFAELMSGDVKLEGLKYIAMAHDLGMFILPENLTEAKKYYVEKEARSMVHVASVDNASINSFLSHADEAGIEHQIAAAALRAAVMFNDKKDSDGLVPSGFWEERVGEFSVVRDSQEASGKTFTDEEWTQVEKKVRDLAEFIGESMDAYRYNLPGGQIFSNLKHKKTDLKALMKKGADEAQRLFAADAELADRMKRAVDAQHKVDHPISDVIVNGLRAKMKAEGIPGAETANLMSFQRSAVAWMEEIKRGVLAYGAGLGKTPISIAAAANLMEKGKIKRCIMVLPANLMEQWPKEIESFRPGSKVQMISSDFSLGDRLRKLEAINKGELEADFVIVSAGTVGFSDEEGRKHLNSIKKDYMELHGKKTLTDEEFEKVLMESGLLQKDPLVQALKKLDGMMIFDEAHSGGQGLKNPKNTHHIITKELLDKREYAFGMTATPMTEGPADLYHLMNLFHPGSAGDSLGQFVDKMVRFEDKPDPVTGKMVKLPIELDRNELRKAKASIKPFVFFQQKTAPEVSKEMTSKGMKLPKLQPVSHVITMDKPTRDVYDASGEMGFDETHEPLRGFGDEYLTDKQMYEKVLAQSGERAAAMALRARFYVRKQKAAISPRLVDKNWKGPQPKIEHTVDIIKRHFNDPDNEIWTVNKKTGKKELTGHKPVVVFGSFMDSLDLMKEELVKAGMPESLIGKITGEVDQEDRDITQEAVNAGKIKVVLVGIKAGGAGLNLQKAAYRNIFLDKPWTPSDMEQAVGRTWRTGSIAGKPGESGNVYVHHMKIANTIDDRKYDRMELRSKIQDALTFAEMDDKYLSETIDDSISRLVGDFDKDVTEWTPEQHKAMLRIAGLKDGDVSPLNKLSVVREKYSEEAFGAEIRAKSDLKVGDQKIAERATMNEINYKAGVINEKAYIRAKKKIAIDAKKWMQTAGVAMDHPVARYTGENWDFKSEAEHSVGIRGKGTKTKAERKPKNAERPAKAHKNVAEKDRPAKMPLDAMKPTPKKAAKLVVPKAAKPVPSKPIKLTPASAFSFKMAKHPFKQGDPMGDFFEAIRRSGSSTYKDSLAAVSDYVYKQYKNELEGDKKKAAKEIAANFFATKKPLEKFAKMGLIEVKS